MNDPIVIVSAARTPMGSFQSDFSSLAAHDLGGTAIQAAVARAGMDPALVTEVLFGNCLMAGQGQQGPRGQQNDVDKVVRLKAERHSYLQVTLGYDQRVTSVGGLACIKITFLSFLRQRPVFIENLDRKL